MKKINWNKWIAAASCVAMAASMTACQSGSKETAAETKTETAASEETKAETAAVETAEKGNPQWDVVWIDSMYDVYALSQDGQLKTGWEPENAAGLTEFSKK